MNIYLGQEIFLSKYVLLYFYYWFYEMKPSLRTAIIYFTIVQRLFDLSVDTGCDQ